jgi:hypothetical protein
MNEAIGSWSMVVLSSSAAKTMTHLNLSNNQLSLLMLILVQRIQQLHLKLFRPQRMNQLLMESVRLINLDGHLIPIFGDFPW